MIRTRDLMAAAVLASALAGVSSTLAVAETEKHERHMPQATMGMSAALLRFPESGLVRVPFRRGAGNHVLLDVVDSKGDKLTFALDTGASVSLLTPSYVKRHANAVDKRPSDAHIKAVGAHGGLSGEMKFGEMRDIGVGDLTIERAGAIVMELPNLDEGLGETLYGILGFNVLSQMTTIIDYAAGEVVFCESHSKAEKTTFGNPDHVVPFTLRGGAIIQLQGSVNGMESIPFMYDVGSPHTMLNADASKSSKIDFKAPEGEERKTIERYSRGLEATVGSAESLEFGSLNFSSPRLISAHLPVFAKVGFGDSDAGILGNDLLAGYRVAIDYGRKELRLWSAEGKAQR